MSEGGVVASFVVPVHPHTVLAPDMNPGWRALRNAYDEAAQTIRDLEADLLIIYSTTWPSIIGHQIQADPNPEWVMVDHDFHDLGSIPYSFNIDAEFAHAWDDANRNRGLQSRCVNYKGFPIDVGSVVALTLLNPDNTIPAVIVSSNMYANRSETTVLAKSCLDVIKAQGRRAVAITAMSLSNRMFTDFIEPADDKIHSLKDDEWNRKILEFLEEGRLEDVGQLSRTIHQQIRVQKVVAFKPMWWLSAMNGNRNDLTGKVLAYEAIHGAGGAVVHVDPTSTGVGDKEYDEDDVEYFHGERGVLDTGTETDENIEQATSDSATGGTQASERFTPAANGPALWDPTEAEGSVNTTAAPKPVGAYPHARRVGDMLYLSGVGPRQPGTNAIPGGPIHDENGEPLDYDIKAQTHAVVENVRRIVEEAGARFDQVVDVTTFLVDMKRDFAGYNEVWAETLGQVGPTRTTLAIDALPTPIAVEMKVIVHLGE
ncbi:MAG: Rid family hydrolase [Candidatus Thermoplasmatota archaeon]|nr:Rid family hydrolase [Candidatus Thermoplasmatota archaeon]